MWWPIILVPANEDWVRTLQSCLLYVQITSKTQPFYTDSKIHGYGSYSLTVVLYFENIFLIFGLILLLLAAWCGQIFLLWEFLFYFLFIVAKFCLRIYFTIDIFTIHKTFSLLNFRKYFSRAEDTFWSRLGNCCLSTPTTWLRFSVPLFFL